MAPLPTLFPRTESCRLDLRIVVMLSTSRKTPSVTASNPSISVHFPYHTLAQAPISCLCYCNCILAVSVFTPAHSLHNSLHTRFTAEWILILFWLKSQILSTVKCVQAQTLSLGPCLPTYVYSHPLGILICFKCLHSTCPALAPALYLLFPHLQ